MHLLGKLASAADETRGRVEREPRRWPGAALAGKPFSVVCEEALPAAGYGVALLDCLDPVGDVEPQELAEVGADQVAGRFATKHCRWCPLRSGAGGERFGESVYVGDGGCNERVCVIIAERHVAGQCKPVGQRTTAMHGKPALYHPQYGVIPIAVSLLAIIWTTIFLTWIQTYLVADDVEDLALVG